MKKAVKGAGRCVTKDLLGVGPQQLLWTCSVARLLKVVVDIRGHCQVSVGIQKMLDLEVGFAS